MNEDTTDITEGVMITIVILAVITFIAVLVWLCIVWAHTFPTTYCTSWTRAVSIQPTNHDNGKYSDEQYIVKYADGSLDGQDQGQIPFARCTHQIRTTAPRQAGWKIVSTYGGVEWDT